MIDSQISIQPLRMKGDERREHILEAAVNLFARHGFSGTTTKEIARAAGVSEAMVFRHFETKEALYGAIIDRQVCQSGASKFPWEDDSELKKAIETGDDHTFFYRIGVRALEKHQRDVEFMRLLFFSALEEHELAERFFNEFVATVYDFIGRYIKRRQAEGAMRDVKPKVAVRAFVGMLIHHSLNNILWDKNRRLLKISNEEAARNFAEILLRGIAK
ncbi:MAG: TetR/AcrR family transcriptional regulator [Pyrinomonadaceae bacterium]